MECRVCAASVTWLDEATLLGRHSVDFFRCSRCGFVQTEEPHWLDEAYEDPINRSDVGLVQRNLQLAAIVGAVVQTLFRGDGPYLDYGGGYGLLVRLLRDRGFDFFRLDPLCENLFARGCDLEDAGTSSFGLVTSFEVFEHLRNPREGLREILRHSDNVLFSTLLLPDPPPPLDRWWYYGLEHGQHVSFFTRRSLELLGRSEGLSLCTDGRSLHLFSREPVSSVLFHLVTRHRVARVIGWFNRRSSLIPEDYARLTGKSLS